MSRIIGISLILGPILLLLVFVGFWPSTEGAKALEQLTANVNVTLLMLMVTGTSFIMLQGGSILLSQRLSEKAEASHKQILMLANLMFLVSLALFMAQGSLILGSMNLYLAGSGDAALMHIISNHVADIMPWTFGVGMLLLGLVAAKGSLQPRVTAALIVPGILFIIGPGINSTNYYLASWMIMTAIIVIVGVSVLLQKD